VDREIILTISDGLECFIQFRFALYAKKSIVKLCSVLKVLKIEARFEEIQLDMKARSE
jgi:hypothetical protein